MPRITQERLLGEKAVISVTGLLNEVGALAEPIRNDLGEDLLVQSQVRGQADPFSILIQVKGVSAPPRDGVVRLRFKVDHLRRWVGHAQPVLVCVFNQFSGQTYAFAPKDKFSMWELWTTDRKTLTVALGDDSLFDASTAERHIWERRLDHFARSMRDIEYRLQFNESRGGDKRTRSRLQRELGIVTFAFLDAIGLIEPDRLPEKFLRGFRNCVRNFAKENQASSDKFTVHQAVVLVLLGHVQDVTGQGLVWTLIAHGSRVLTQFLRSFHAADWKRAAETLPLGPIE